ncbi:hypothetical protein N8587_01475 [Akkermansiaceae bacterium]|nr:hypothetical protein [Akkermansiaceae bacterium]
MNLYEYIAVNNSLGANELLKNYGLKPTRSVKEIISRLKVIVRKYKKDALQDISTIHPDRSLLTLFNSSDIKETNFANATGRTPSQSNANGTPITPINNDYNQKDVVRQIEEAKKEMLIDKLRDEKKDLDRRISNTQYGNSPVILLAIGFAVGYMIAKK